MAGEQAAQAIIDEMCIRDRYEPFTENSRWLRGMEAKELKMVSERHG